MRKLKDRKFVAFDSVMVDVNSIEASAYQLQQRQGQDASGNPIVTDVQVAVLMLESGSSVTIGGDSLKKFEHWWKENVESEKVELPAEVVKAVAPPLAENVKKPASPLAPAAKAVVASPAPVAPETTPVEKPTAVATETLPQAAPPKPPNVPAPLPSPPTPTAPPTEK